MGCCSNSKVKAFFSSIYTYIGFFLLFYVIAFAIEANHTHSSCKLSSASVDGSMSVYRDCRKEFNPDPCDAPAMVAKSQYSGQILGKDFNGEVNMVCAWSTKTLVMNYLSIPIVVVFFVLFSRISKRFKFLHIMLAGLLAAIFILISIILMIKDIDSGLKHKQAIEPTTSRYFSYYPAVFIVNVIFTILAFLLLLRIFVFAYQRNRQLAQKQPTPDTEAQQPMAESEKQREKEEKKKEKERQKQEKKTQKKEKKKEAGKNEPQFENENDEFAPAIRL